MIEEGEGEEEDNVITSSIAFSINPDRLPAGYLPEDVMNI